MANVDLKNLEQSREKMIYQNAEEQLNKLFEHGVFYISTSSTVETVALIKRFVHNQNLREFDNMDMDFSTGNLMTVKHFVPRASHLPDEVFTKTEMTEKLHELGGDEFAYITGIVNAVIKDMYMDLNNTVQGNIEEKRAWMEKFHESIAKKIDNGYRQKISQTKMKALDKAVDKILFELEDTELKSKNQDAVKNVMDMYFTERKNLSTEQKNKMQQNIATTTGAMHHIYLLPSYILGSSNERLVYVTKYLLELVMSSYYEFRHFLSQQTQLDVCNNYRIAFVGPREDISSMPVRGFKHIELEILPKDLVETYLEIYYTKVQSNFDSETPLTDELKEKFYQTFKNLSSMEFVTLINEMSVNEIVVNDNFIEVNKNYRVEKSSGITPVHSSVTFDDLAGVENIYEYAINLKNSIQNPTKLQKYNISAVKGVLISGIPGTAKSSLAGAITNLLEIPLYQLEVGALMSHLVGKSENNVKTYLSALQKLGRVGLWIDEFEKAFAGASSEVTDSGTSNRVYQIFLTFLAENENVILIATANDLTRLPAEFMRSGRFDKKFFIDVPSETDRKAIFKVMLKRHNLPELISNENCEKLSKASEHYTGADIQKVVELAIRSNLDNVTLENIQSEIAKHKPDAQSFKEQYKVLRKKAKDFESASRNVNESKHLGFEDYLTFVKSPITLEDVGGMDVIKSDLSKLKQILENSEEAKKFGIKVVKNFILSGVPGVGKSLVIKATANYLGKKLFRLDLGSLFSKYVGESFENVKNALEAAVSLSQDELVILWMDELEKLFNNMNNSSTESHILQYFLTWLEEQDKVLVMATANDLSKIPVELIRSGRFDYKYFIDLPTTEERVAIIESVINRINSQSEFKHSIDNIALFAEKTKYFSGSDINNIIEKAINESFLDSNSTLVEEKLFDNLETYRPDSQTHATKYQTIREDYGAMFQPASSLSKFSERLDMGKYVRKVDCSKFSFKTVGAMENVKKYINKEKVFFLKSNEAKEFGIQVPKGIMLAGLSGCGKTAVAQAITTELDVEMYSLVMSDIVNKFTGESESNFKKVLDSIKKISKEKKIAFFIDEFDKAFGNAMSEHKQNILQEFLQFLQDDHDNIFIIVTANNTSLIPPELMRTGRLDKKFFVHLPSASERIAILQSLITRRNLNVSIAEKDMDEVAEGMKGFTGADIENVLNEVIKLKYVNGDTTNTISKELFEEVVCNYVPDSKMLSHQLDDNMSKQFTPASLEKKSNVIKTAIGFSVSN
jgi:SpoVK/Ycf46/Vps4 family AAA+-type ATPase